MADNRTAKVILSYEVDQASAKRAEDSAKRVRQAVGQAQAAQIGAVDPQTGQRITARSLGIDAIASEVRRLTQEGLSAQAAMARVKQRLDDIGATKDEIDRVRGSVEQLGAAEQKRGGIRGALLGGATFRQTGFLLRSIPGGGLPETVGRLSPLADVAADFAEGTSKAGIGLLGITGAAVAFTAAIQLAAQNVQRRTEEIKKQLDLERNYEREARDLSTRANRERLQEVERQLEIERQQLVEDFAAQQQAFENLRGALDRPGGALRAGAELVFGGEFQDLSGTQGALRQQYVEQAAIVNDLTTEQLQLNRALLDNSNVVADVRDAAQRASELDQTTADEREKLIDANNREIVTLLRLTENQLMNADVQEYVAERTQYLIDYNRDLGNTFDTTADRAEALAARLEEFRDRVQRAIDVQNMDAEERRERIAEIEREINAWQVFRSTVADNTQEADAADEAMRGLNSELMDLWNIASTNADVLNHLNALQENLDDSTQAYFDNLTNSTEDFARAVADWTAAQQEAADKIAQIQADALDKETEAQQDANDRRDELQAKFDKDREKVEEAHQKRIQKIVRDANDAIADAIGNRDALAAYLAQRQAAKDIADEEERRKERLEQIDEAYKEQSDAIDKRLQKQLADIQANARKQVDAVNARLRQEEALYRRAEQQRAADLINHNMQLASITLSNMQTSLFRTQNYYQTAASIEEVYQNASLFRLQAWWGSVLNTFSGGTGGGGGVGPGGGGIGSPAATAFSPNGAANSQLNLAIDARINYLRQRAITR